MRKIMVCHDGSGPAQSALERTVDLFKSVRPEIILVTVVEPPLDATSVDEDNFEKWKDKRNRDLKEAAEWTAGHGYNVDAILAVGDPRKMIIKAAEEKGPEFVVVARRGATSFERMDLGSVAAYVVRHSPCPVAVF